MTLSAETVAWFEAYKPELRRVRQNDLRQVRGILRVGNRDGRTLSPEEITSLESIEEQLVRDTREPTT